MIIIGITGTLGAGKGTVVDYLVQNKGFTHYSVRAFLRKELESRHMPVNRDTLLAIANTLRAKYGPAHIVEQLYAQASTSGKPCVIESIRTPGEVYALRSLPGFSLLAVDADPRVRYRRIKTRNSETDQVSYQTFVMNEEREMHTSNPNHQNLSECIRLADHTIMNNGSLNELHQHTEEFLIQCGYNNTKHKK